GAGAWPDRRLPRTGDREPLQRPTRRLREASDRASRRIDPRRRAGAGLGRRPQTLGAVRDTGEPADGSAPRTGLAGTGGLLFHVGRQPRRIVRLARVGRGAALEPDRAGRAHVLAGDADLVRRLNGQGGFADRGTRSPPG